MMRNRFRFSALLLFVFAAPSAFAADDHTLTTLSQQGDAQAGRKVFINCRSCHNVTDGSRARMGPNLFQIFGRVVGTSKSYKRYSAALREAEFEWTEKRLFAFLEDPNAYLPGIQPTMRLRKIADEQKRKDLIAFLRQATERQD